VDLIAVARPSLTVEQNQNKDWKNDQADETDTERINQKKKKSV